MTCRDVRARMTAFVDGELDAQVGSSVRGHLRGCAECADQVARERVIAHSLARLSPPEPPADLLRAINAEVARQEAADARRGRLWLSWRSIRGQLPGYSPALGLSAIAAVLAVTAWWRHAGPSAASENGMQLPAAPSATAAARSEPAAARSEPATVVPLAPPTQVDTSLLDESEAQYRAVITELLTMLADDRAAWSSQRSATFTREVSSLEAQAAGASRGRPRERALQATIAYLQDALLQAPASLVQASAASPLQGDR